FSFQACASFWCLGSAIASSGGRSTKGYRRSRWGGCFLHWERPLRRTVLSRGRPYIVRRRTRRYRGSTTRNKRPRRKPLKPPINLQRRGSFHRLRESKEVLSQVLGRSGRTR